MTNSVDPDETARNKPSHLDHHFLRRYLFWSAWMKGLINKMMLLHKSFIDFVAILQLLKKGVVSEAN